MRFSYTDDQLAFREAAADLLAKECTPAVVRAAWDAAAGELDLGVWRSLDAMGVLSILVPEADGGLGLDECSLVGVLEAAGVAALPHPIVESAMVAAPLGVDVSSQLVTSTLGGRAACLLDADAVLVADGDRLVLVDDFEVERVETVDGGRRTGELRADVGAGATVAEGADAVALAFDRGVLGTAAQLVGLSRAMLGLTVDYVKERQQFGAPVGSFQAVKHHLANALLAIEFAAPAVARAAATTAAAEASRSRDVSMAKALATDAADATGRAALQCHGAIGYTVEHDLHLSLKRSWALARAWGDRGFHAERVAAALEL
jgi:alkylation response protein AidB-like acyl-CoA dehydrogenase